MEGELFKRGKNWLNLSRMRYSKPSRISQWKEVMQ
jgi:hypothetical protein